MGITKPSHCTDRVGAFLILALVPTAAFATAGQSQKRSDVVDLDMDSIVGTWSREGNAIAGYALDDPRVQAHRSKH